MARITDEMIDRLIEEGNEFECCPVCDYSGHWRTTQMNSEESRRNLKELLHFVVNGQKANFFCDTCDASLHTDKVPGAIKCPCCTDGWMS